VSDWTNVGSNEPITDEPITTTAARAIPAQWRARRMLELGTQRAGGNKADCPIAEDKGFRLHFGLHAWLHGFMLYTHEANEALRMSGDGHGFMLHLASMKHHEAMKPTPKLYGLGQPISPYRCHSVSAAMTPGLTDIYS
jgi:hypothetical protein